MVRELRGAVADLSPDKIRKTAVYLHSTADAAERLQRCEDEITRALRVIADEMTEIYRRAIVESESLDRQVESESLDRRFES